MENDQVRIRVYLLEAACWDTKQGVLVDLYVPRKCAATSQYGIWLQDYTTWPNCQLSDRLITSKDHASVQIAIADVDANGRALPTTTTFALCGQVRSQGESDDSMNRLATKAGCESLLYLPAIIIDRNSSAPQCLVIPKVNCRHWLCSISSRYPLSRPPVLRFLKSI